MCEKCIHGVKAPTICWCHQFIVIQLSILLLSSCSQLYIDVSINSQHCIGVHIDTHNSIDVFMSPQSYCACVLVCVCVCVSGVCMVCVCMVCVCVCVCVSGVCMVCVCVVCLHGVCGMCGCGVFAWCVWYVWVWCVSMVCVMGLMREIIVSPVQGGSVIRMLRDWMGEENFRQGIQVTINRCGWALIRISLTCVCIGVTFYCTKYQNSEQIDLTIWHFIKDSIKLAADYASVQLLYMCVTISSIWEHMPTKMLPLTCCGSPSSNIQWVHQTTWKTCLKISVLYTHTCNTHMHMYIVHTHAHSYTHICTHMHIDIQYSKHYGHVDQTDGLPCGDSEEDQPNHCFSLTGEVLLFEAQWNHHCSLSIQVSQICLMVCLH